MNVAGIDYSTRAVDVVLIPYEGSGAPSWHRFPLTGPDAFDRTRSVADVMPGRHSVFWDDVLAIGIEHPGGHHGTRDMLRVQGAILSCLPARLLVEPWPPAKWRTANGLKGNASKDIVSVYAAFNRWNADPRFVPSRDPNVDYEAGIFEWPQDACDAYCIALATRRAITREQAA